MAEHEEKREDADAGTQLDKVLSHLDALHKRMDAMEERDKKREDAEETIRYFGKGANKGRTDAEEDEKKDSEKADAEDEKKDAAKADADDKEEEKKDSAKADAEKSDSVKADAAKSEDKEELERELEGAKHEMKEIKEKSDAAAAKQAAELQDVRSMLDRLQRQMPKDLSDEQFQELHAAQARADAVYHAMGGQAPMPLRGEDALTYRRRVTALLKEHSPKYKDIGMNEIRSDALFEIAEGQIYADAMNFANSPATAEPGKLREIRRPDGNGHIIITYAGEPAAWMDSIAGGYRRHVTNLVTNQGAAR